MHSRPSDEPEAIAGHRERSDRSRRLLIVAACAIVVSAIDSWLILWLIPWVDRQEWARTLHGDVGYALFFVMVLFTVMVSIALVAFLFSRSSYASDKWQ